MVRNRSRRRSDEGLLTDLESALRPAPRVRLPGLAWRWRYECLIAGLLAAAIITLVRVLGGVWTVVCVSALVGALGPWPPWHEPFLADLWWLVTPHRLHRGFAEARIQTRQGKLPVILRTTVKPFGERVRVWCPAGICAEDFESARPILRAACWATDVQVTRDERRAHLVAIDVIRRPDA